MIRGLNKATAWQVIEQVTARYNSQPLDSEVLQVEHVAPQAAPVPFHKKKSPLADAVAGEREEGSDSPPPEDVVIVPAATGEDEKLIQPDYGQSRTEDEDTYPSRR